MPDTLSPDEVRVAAEAALRDQRAELLDRFDALLPRPGLSAEEESRILDVDKAKEVFPHFAENEETRSRYGTAVYDSAVKLIEQLYRRRIVSAEHGSCIAFTGGGPGAGKSSLLSSLLSDLTRDNLLPWAIVDGTMADCDRVVAQMRLAQEMKLDIEVWFLFREFESAVGGFIERAAHIGRAIPLKRVADKHLAAWTTLMRLVDTAIVPTDAVSVYEMVSAIEGERAFERSSLDRVRNARNSTTLEKMVEVAYNALYCFRKELPTHIYDELAKR